MSKPVYLINPDNDYPSYFGFEEFAGWGRQPAVKTADLAIITLAGVFSEDFDVFLCDEHVTPVDAIPKWGKYPNNRPLTGTPQTSRGCPFEIGLKGVDEWMS